MDAPRNIRRSSRDIDFHHAHGMPNSQSVRLGGDWADRAIDDRIGNAGRRCGCRGAGVAILFAPDAQEVYPTQFQTFVEPGELANPLCGAFRPGHFRSVATVVSKLFNMVQPDVAFFGQKDFQQCAVVRRMVVDLNLPIEIVTVPTVREPDGLAMSSRNRYLNEEQRRRALAISRGLFTAEAEFRSGERDAEPLSAIAKRHLEGVDQLQYLGLVDGDTLKPAEGSLSRPAALCVAAYVGSTRLIDNVILGPTPRRHAHASQSEKPNP